MMFDMVYIVWIIEMLLSRVFDQIVFNTFFERLNNVDFNRFINAITRFCVVQ